jgi:hypothetical protein
MAGGRRMGTPTGSHISDYPVVGGAGGKAGGFSDTGSRLHGSPGPKGMPIHTTIIALSLPTNRFCTTTYRLSNWLH